MTQRFTDAQRLDFLQDASKLSRTGFSIDWVPSADGEPSGFRVMTFHNIGPAASTVRDAIDRAMGAAVASAEQAEYAMSQRR